MAVGGVLLASSGLVLEVGIVEEVPVATVLSLVLVSLSPLRVVVTKDGSVWFISPIRAV